MATQSQLWLYISGYAAADQPGIRAFLFDTTTGSLSAGGSFAGILNPSFIVIHPNRRWLYAVSETSQHQEGRSGEVWALHLPTHALGEPREINHQPSGGDWPCNLAIDASGQWLLVSNYQSGSLGVFSILPDGALGAMTDHVQHHGSGPNKERQASAHVHSATFSPDNRSVILADLGMDQLVIYAFDASTGRLYVHSHVDSEPGSGPRHKVFHPNKRFFYVSHELASTVTAFEYKADSGELTGFQSISTLPPMAHVQENLLADIHVAPTGNRLYVSNRGHDSVTVYTIAADGQLERLAVQPCGGHWPRQFAIAPGGQFLLVANQYSGEITVLPVLDEPAALGKVCTRVPFPGASCVQFFNPGNV